MNIVCTFPYHYKGRRVRGLQRTFATFVANKQSNGSNYCLGVCKRLKDLNDLAIFTENYGLRNNHRHKVKSISLLFLPQNWVE